jgi:hypothetical protein
MSVYLNSCAFSYPAKWVTPKTCYGYTIYDDYEQTYYHNSQSPILDDLELLNYVVNNWNESARTILRLVRNFESGIIINGTEYKWQEIKNIIDKLYS